MVNGNKTAISKLEANDNKTENYIMDYIFSNNKLVDKMFEIFMILYKKHKIFTTKNKNILVYFYKKFRLNKKSHLGKDQRDDITILFFGKPIINKSELIKVINDFSKDISSFREKDIEEKGIVFYFIEVIIEKLINIDDISYKIFKQSKQDRDELFKIVYDIIEDGLDILKEDTDEILYQYETFFDKYIDFDNNFLDNQELQWFKEKYLDMVFYLVTFMTTKLDVIEKISKIESRIKNHMIFD